MKSNYFIHRILHMTIFNGVFVEKTIVMFYFFSFDMFMNCCLTCSCFTTFHSSQSLKFRSRVFDFAQNLRIMFNLILVKFGIKELLGLSQRGENMNF